MKTKTIYIILSILLIISIALNIYEYNNINTLKSQCTTLQSDIDSLNNEINSLNDTISSQQDEITSLSSEKTDLENSIEELQAYQDQLDAESAESDESDSPSTPTTTDFEVQSLDSQTKYAKQQVNVRKGPGIDYEKTGSLSTNEEVTVIGLVPTDHGDWYQLGDEERNVVGYVSATYLVDTKVTVSTSNSSSSGTSSTASNSGNSGSTSNSSSSSSSSSSGASSNFGGLDVTGFDTSGGTITGGKDGSHASDGVGSGHGADITVY
jgi:uncharacterized protein YgiM (DUF1202 family)